MNRFKGLDLVKCLKNYGWRFMTLYRRQGVQEAGVKTIPKKKKCNEAKCLSGEPYKELRKEEKQKTKKKRKDIPI